MKILRRPRPVRAGHHQASVTLSWFLAFAGFAALIASDIRMLRDFGIGADVSEAQWRGVLRQLLALGYVRASKVEVLQSKIAPIAHKGRRALKADALPDPVYALLCVVNRVRRDHDGVI